MASHTSLHQNIPHSSIDCRGPKQTTIDLVGGILCKICRLTFATKQSYDSHYRSHGASTEIIYTCNICFKEIVGYPSFRGHCYTSHVIKERFQCEHCLKQFSKISNLKDHVNRIHKFKCPTCRKEFPSKKEMLLHQIIHNSMEHPPYNCNTCKIEIDTADECKEHVEKHLKFLYSCPICNDNISDKENTADHMKKHFGNVLSEDNVDEETSQSSEDTSEEFSGIMCQFCSLILGDRVKFDAHFSCKHGDEDIVYMCVECGMSFEKYSVFKNHCYDHSLRNRYKCQICKKSFPRLSMLAAHTAACQAAGSARGQKVFGCPSCSRRFASMSRWREHLRVAHGMHRHLPCPHDRCDRTFETPKQLILHQQSHEIKNQNFCSQCRLVFSNVASCERHIDMHKKKIFFCPICKRNAKDKKVIMNHISQHFEAISHLCRICGKIYNTKKSLIEHLKTHKKVKSYSCTHCNKSFLKPSQLEQHVNTHTGVKPYKCPICVKSFSNYPNWVKHVRRMHHEESIYIRNPIVDHADSIDAEDSLRNTTDKERDVVNSNNTFNNDICADNNKVNNNYQVLNTNEHVSITNTDQNVSEANHIKSINIKSSINNGTVTINNKESAMEITFDEKYDMSKDINKKSHLDGNKCNIVDENNINSKNIVIQVVNHVVGIEDKASTMETSNVIENGVTKDIQKEDFDQSMNTDEQNMNTLLCSKPHKCPICEKSFAKYSYMSKHLGRVHHIRSIDIKNLIIDHQEGNDDEGSIMEATANEEIEMSTDNAKCDNNEQLSSGDKPKVQMNSNAECHIHGSKPYQCPICDKSFAKYAYMTKHVRKIHQKKRNDIKSPISDRMSYVDELSVMDTGVDEENESSADVMKDDSYEQFPSPENKNIDKPHKCHICEKSFAKYPYMTKHVRKVHNKKIVDIKKSIFNLKEGAAEEISAIETLVDRECDISVGNVKDNNGVQYLNTDKLPNVEQFTNIGSKPYKCPTCDKSFAKHSYMSKHVRTVHNKKNTDIKNQLIDNKESIDDDGSAMEIVVDEENDVFTDHSKDDNDEQVSNTDHQMDIGHKPYKCPMCEKSFAQDRYCRKHVRRIHYKKSMDIKSPHFDSTNSSVAGTLTETDNEIVTSQDYLKNEISNMHSISIVNQAETTDCLNDIDDANASMDFANIRLENYIFSVQRDGPMDIVPSTLDGKYLLNVNNDGNSTLNKDLFTENSDGNLTIRKDIIYESKGNTPIGTELVNENGEAIALVEKDLFNANRKDSAAIEKDLFNPNSMENDNPIDILEYIAEMPENNSLFVPVISQEALAPCAQPPAEAVTYPYEYGPEFSAGFDAACTGGFIDLDDHMLPHIDPLLTINNQTCVQMPNNQNYDYNVIDAADLLALGNEACDKMYAAGGQPYDGYDVAVAGTEYAAGWDPPVPVLTKLCDQYAYGYGEMPEASRVPIMNTDIF